MATEPTPSGARTVGLPPIAGTDSSAPLPVTKYTVEESGDHSTAVMPSGMLASRCWLVSTPRGVGLAMGVGDGDGDGGGWVTNVMVFGAVSDCPAAVLAPGPIVTWYWVFGARLPAVGVTDKVFSCHEKATVVAGAIWTAASVDGWSIGWLNVTWIGCCRRTALWLEMGLVTTT